MPPLWGKLLCLAVGFLILRILAARRFFAANTINGDGAPKHEIFHSANSATFAAVASRGTVLCAHSSQTLRQAWTQIQVLKRLHGMQDDAFTVYHADELHESDESIRDGISKLEALPNVRVQSLAGWYASAYGNQSRDEGGLKRFQGFFCKIGALLASSYDVVALVDLDVALMASPFDLAGSSVFRKTGTYLFRDRRLSARYNVDGQTSEQYRNKMQQLWRMLRPDRPHNVSLALTGSPPFNGWTYDYGESAVVLLDKRRHTQALRTMQTMVGPELFDDLVRGIHGDKEVYWQALALADEEPGMNPFACADVGRTDERGNKTCCYMWTNGQWAWDDEGGLRVFYVNGDGVERMVDGTDDTLFRSWISDPLDYFSSRVPYDYLDTCCNYGANPLPSYVIETFHVYRLAFESYDNKPKRYKPPK